MNKKFSYQTLICTALVMMSGTIHTMSSDKKSTTVTATEPTFALSSSEPLKFKFAAEISNTVTRTCKVVGFLTACAEQAYVAHCGLFAEHPVAGGTGIMVQWPLSFLFVRIFKNYQQTVIDGLHTQQDSAIRAIFDHMHQPPMLLDKEPEREEKAAAFITMYKQMRSREIALDAAVVDAHNNVLRRSVANKSFAQGFMCGTALGPLPALLVLHMLGRI